MSLAEASEARQLTCDEVRSSWPRSPRASPHDASAEAPRARLRALPQLPQAAPQDERRDGRRLFPVGPLLALKKLLLAKAGAAAFAGRGRRRRARWWHRGAAAGAAAAGATAAAGRDGGHRRRRVARWSAPPPRRRSPASPSRRSSRAARSRRSASTPRTTRQKAGARPVTAPSRAPPARPSRLAGTAISDVPPALVDKPSPRPRPRPTSSSHLSSRHDRSGGESGTTAAGGRRRPASHNPAPHGAPGVEGQQKAPPAERQHDRARHGREQRSPDHPRRR